MYTEETQRVLRLALDEFSLPKFYLLFGISKVKSAAVTAFRSSCRHPNERWLGNERVSQTLPPDRERLALPSLEVITDALLEIMETCMRDVPDCDWLQTWTSLARSFAFCHNPALQPRALIVYGCISKSATDQDVKEILRILVKALESFNDIVLIEALVMCLTRIQPLLRQVITSDKYLKNYCSLELGFTYILYPYTFLLGIVNTSSTILGGNICSATGRCHFICRRIGIARAKFAYAEFTGSFR